MIYYSASHGNVRVSFFYSAGIHSANDAWLLKKFERRTKLLPHRMECICLCDSFPCHSSIAYYSAIFGLTPTMLTSPILLVTTDSSDTAPPIFFMNNENTNKLKFFGTKIQVLIR